LLLLFAQSENKIVSAEYLYEKIWGREMHDDVRALQKRVSNLREKIKGSGYAISTVRNTGYRFEKKSKNNRTSFLTISGGS